MTPKEKAEDLVDKMYKSDSSIYLTYNMAKQCALIAVDEIISICNLMDGGFSFEHEIQYWQEVKNEINLL